MKALIRQKVWEGNGEAGINLHLRGRMVSYSLPITGMGRGSMTLEQVTVCGSLWSFNMR